LPRKRHVRRAKSSDVHQVPIPGGRAAVRGACGNLVVIRGAPAGPVRRCALTGSACFRVSVEASIARALPCDDLTTIGSAPPRFWGTGPRKAGPVTAGTSPPTHTPTFGARTRRNPEHSYRGKRAAMLSSCAKARICIASCRKSTDGNADFAGPYDPPRPSCGGGAWEEFTFMFASSAFQITSPRFTNLRSRPPGRRRRFHALPRLPLS
jgi:hypothetical protein